MNDLLHKIQLLKGDITKIAVDAIVNAANSSLMGGGGVDGAIHRAGGKQILEECKMIAAKQGGCETGKAVITTAGRLPAKYVIHTVGPVWQGGNKNEHQKLSACYSNSLSLSAQYGCKTVSFPNISTGVYGFPKEAAAKISIEAVTGFLSLNEVPGKVLFVCFDEENYFWVEKYLNLRLSL
jgi:O-acetyl-ADP-ribose deacetylase (regulator of RNase III)